MSKNYDFNRFFQIEGEDKPQTSTNIMDSINMNKVKMEVRIDNYYAEYKEGSEESIAKDLSEYSILDVISTASDITREHRVDSNYARPGYRISPIYLAVRVLGILESEKLAEYNNNDKEKHDDESNYVLNMIRNRQKKA